MAPPLAVDIDGTLTRSDWSIDPRIIDALGSWPAPVVIATGKAMPYPVALTQFVGLETLVVAENGGVAVSEESLEILGDRTAADAVAAEYRDAGHEIGYGDPDLANRWRETEIVVARSQPLEPLEEIAATHGLEVVDSEFAYHVKSPDVSKGQAFESLASIVGIDPDETVAFGDSPNDVSLFETVGTAHAMGNGTEEAKAAADEVTSASYADGFLEAMNAVMERR
jgi:phosphoglycolate phosphatase (TIGR01487 family)